MQGNAARTGTPVEYQLGHCAGEPLPVLLRNLYLERQVGVHHHIETAFLQRSVALETELVLAGGDNRVKALLCHLHILPFAAGKQLYPHQTLPRSEVQGGVDHYGTLRGSISVRRCNGYPRVLGLRDPGFRGIETDADVAALGSDFYGVGVESELRHRFHAGGSGKQQRSQCIYICSLHIQSSSMYSQLRISCDLS